jgi:hypothetical protein
MDDLAVAYPKADPDQLLLRVRRHLSYVNQLLDVRKTLAEHGRLAVAGGRLSLLAATCSIDLAQRPAAAARLRTQPSWPSTANTQSLPAGAWKHARGRRSRKGPTARRSS